METREGNLILNVDKVLTNQQNEFLEHIAKLLGKLVEEKDGMIWAIAGDCIVRMAMSLRIAKQMIGEGNE